MLWGDQSMSYGDEVVRSADVFLFDVKNWGRDTIFDFDEFDTIMFTPESGVGSIADLEFQGSVAGTLISFTPSSAGPNDVNEIFVRGAQPMALMDDIAF